MSALKDADFKKKEELKETLQNKYDYLYNIFLEKEIDIDEELNIIVKNIGIQKIKYIYELLLSSINNNELTEFDNLSKKNMINSSSDEYNEYNVINDYFWKSDEDEINEIIEESIENNKLEPKYDYIEYFNKIKELNNIQKETINKITSSDFTSGLVCICTGGGKSLIMLNLIEIFKNNYLEKSRTILIFTERKNILLDLFFTLEKGDDEKYKYVKKEVHWQVWKALGYINLFDFNVINLVSNKDKDWTNFEKYDKTKINLIIINRSFLVSSERYEKISYDTSPQLILFDECHSITGKTVFKFLEYAKSKWNSKILGFSATPIRNAKSKNNQNLATVIKIFPNPNNEDKINLIVNYNISDAIKDGVCCPLNFVWFKSSSNLTGNQDSKKQRFQDIGKREVDECMRMLDHHIDKLNLKKIISWTSTIKNSRLYKKFFIEMKDKESFNNLSNISVYLDNSKKEIEEINDYKNFYEAENNSILFCVAKHREGSDIKNLDCGIFLDKVENRTDIVWLQSVGRISRKAPEKKYGLIIDTFYEKENNNECEAIVDKLIGYYIMLDGIAFDTNYQDKKESYEMAKKTITLNHSDKIIQLGEINITCEGIDWNNFAQKFDAIFDKSINKKIKLEGKDRLNSICSILKDKYEWNENTYFWEEYEKNNDKESYDFPEDIYNEFKNIFEVKNWYQLMEFKPKWFKTVSMMQDFFSKNKSLNF